MVYMVISVVIFCIFHDTLCKLTFMIGLNSDRLINCNLINCIYCVIIWSLSHVHPNSALSLYACLCESFPHGRQMQITTSLLCFAASVNTLCLHCKDDLFNDIRLNNRCLLRETRGCVVEKNLDFLAVAQVVHRLYVVASKCYRNHFISETYKTVQPCKLLFPSKPSPCATLHFCQQL